MVRLQKSESLLRDIFCPDDVLHLFRDFLLYREANPERKTFVPRQSDPCLSDSDSLTRGIHLGILRVPDLLQRVQSFDEGGLR